MAQYYQVTSLEELHKLYPNLQLDNLEGIQCMVQDDQVSQYADGQGQQVITTIEQTGMQLSHNTSSPQQCTSHPSQLLVHQGTQYVIQQLDTSDSQASAVQYLQQGQPSIQNKEEIPLVQFKDQNVRCVSTDIGNEEHPVQQCVIKQESNQQYLPQVQPVLQQPIQIHQQIQAVDMGANILLLQNHEQQELINQNKSQEIISNSHENQQQLLTQSQSQPQHILIQRHHQQKPQQMMAQKQLAQKNENSQDCAQSQMFQSRHPSQSVGQQQQIIHPPQQQIIQPLQYFNQVTVIDNFSPPRVTIEQRLPSNDTMVPQQQGQTEVQQLRPKKNVQQTNLSGMIQPQQVLLPQRFELTSPPPVGTTMAQAKKKILEEDIERPNAPVFIVQKLDNSFILRQNQAKPRPQSSVDKSNEGPYQSISTQSEEQVESLTQDNRQLPSPSVSIKQVEAPQKLNITGQILDSQSNKSPEKTPSYNQVKVGIIDQSFENKSAEQICKPKVCSPLQARTTFAKIKTVEQQTEPSGDGSGKEVGTQPFQRFNNSETQLRSIPTLSPQMQPQVDMQNQIQIPSRGRGIRVPSPRGCQFVARPRGVPLQTSVSTPRFPNVERGGMCRKLRPPRGGGKVGGIGCVTSTPEQRQLSFVRPGLQQVSPTTAPKNETNQSDNEIVEEARMVVLLINGEKKIVKIPCSQNILLGQILQQAGLSLTSSTPITIEQAVDSSSDQHVKNNSPNSHQITVGFKQLNTPQVVNVQSSPGTPRSIITSIHQRPRGQTIYAHHSPNVGIIKHRLQFPSPRMSSPNYSGSTTITANTMSETVTSMSQGAQNSTQTPVKEEPRYVSGFMAICPFCGISSLDFNKCIRCRRKLPENVKSQSICSVKKKKEKASGINEKGDDSKSESDEKALDSYDSEEKEKISSLQGCDKRKLKPCLKKKKLSDEPTEILILSSDDEEDSKVKKVGANESALPVLKKEPVYTDSLIESEMAISLKEGNSNEDSLKIQQPGSFTTLQCRTIRIGSYKVHPKERILVSPRGIRMVVDSLKDVSTTIIISIADILKVLIHAGRQMPVMFLYPLPKIGTQIRDVLGMDNKLGPYYDPTSTEDETHKRITLLLEKITDENKIAINKIFGPEKLEDLTEKEANEILLRASPVDSRNTNFIKAVDTVRKILVYPPPPEKGGIALNNQDYACLGEDQFLNDVIIDFYLKYLLLKVLSPDDRNRTHVFSTFFYKRLTTKPKTLRKNDPENDPKLSPAEKRHLRVKGWTKQVNLFEKDFIIVPINEHSHWFLAIICFPGLTGPVRFSDNSPVEPEEILAKKNSPSLQIGSTTITHVIKTGGNTVNVEGDSCSDRDEAEGDQDDLHPSSDDEGSEQVEEESSASSPVQIPLLASSSQTQVLAKDSKPKLVKRKAFREPIKQPCILIFDSLSGASRVRVVATLRDYLKIEYKKKMGEDRDFSKDTIKGAVPKVPQQNNFTDCGLYLLQYVESFFQDPLYDFKLPLKYLQDWFTEEVVSSKRQKLALLIRSLMEEQGIKAEEMGLPVLTFTNGSNTVEEQPRIAYEEAEDEELNEDDEEEEEEIMRSKVHISGYHEDDDEMALDEEEELVDEEEEEEDEEEMEEEYEDEDLEMGEIPGGWVSRASDSCGESPVKSNRPLVYKTSALVEYDPSDSDEEGQTLHRHSFVISETQTTVSPEIPEQRDYNTSTQSILSENIKTVPLTEFQDFESQISCTTIEKNFEGKIKSEMVISGEEVVEEQCRAPEEEETTFENPIGDEKNFVTDGFNQSVVDKKIYKPNEVTDIIKKLVSDKNITISRKDHELNSSLIRKHLEVKKFKVKDCDTGEEVEKTLSPNSPPKVNLGTYKRPCQTLKSVRIQKKTDRNLELCSKRQKIDER